MKNLKELTIKVTYQVGLADLQIPDDISEQVVSEIEAAHDSGQEITADNLNYSNAYQWIIDNIHQQDCCEYSAEVAFLNQGGGSNE